ncbi:Intersectin 1 (SH3 domain protein) [Coemansia sp. RSA 1933]|nr:Intersectin 1 (SH3 domain protein) [Coemansia sp. RSA 1933]
MRAKAIYACAADNSGELSFEVNDTLTNIEDSSEDGWLSGIVQRTGHCGLFPAVYVELQIESNDDLVFLRKLRSQGLLSSTMELELCRRDLDSGALLTRPTVASKPSGLTTTTKSVNARRAENTMTVTDTSSSRTTTSSLYSESVETTASMPSYVAATTTPVVQQSPATYQKQKPSIAYKPVAALKTPPVLPPKTTKPLINQSPTVINNDEAELARQREADAASAWEKAHLAKKPTTLSESREAARLISGLSSATSTSNSRLQQSQMQYERQKQQPIWPEVPTKPAVSIARSSLKTEERKHDQEREEADLWEAKHGIGAKSANSSVSATRSVHSSNGTGVASRQMPPVVPTKPVVKPRSPVSTKPVVKPVIQQRAVIPTKPAVIQQRAVVPAKPTYQSPPAIPPKPSAAAAAVSAGSRTTTTTRQNSYSSERTTSSMASSNPAIIATPPELPYNSVRASTRERIRAKEEEETVYSSDPGTIVNPPALPYSAKRTAIKEQSKEYQYESHSNTRADTIIEAPSLPFRQGSYSTAEPFKPIEKTMQPSPQHLISRINSGSKLDKNGANAFEDSFDPFKHQAVSRVASNSPSSHSIGAPAAGTNYTTMSYHSTSSYSSSVTTTTSTDSRTSIPDDALARYAHLFNKLNKQFGNRGYLTSSEVRAVVAKSRLPEDQMRQILALSDRNMDGRFGPGEFNLIMHLADTALRHDPIPDSVPVDLLHAAYAR